MSVRPCQGRRLERGAASWVTVVLLLGMATFAYAAVVFGPSEVLHYEVKQVVREYGNQAVKNRNDAELVESMVKKIRALHETTWTDDAGRLRRAPTVDLRVQDVTWERTAEPPTLHVAFEYPRTLELPFLDRTVERTYAVDLTMDTTRPDWGPVR